jgi:hypothetical protein
VSAAGEHDQQCPPGPLHSPSLATTIFSPRAPSMPPRNLRKAP